MSTKKNQEKSIGENFLTVILADSLAQDLLLAAILAERRRFLPFWQLSPLWGRIRFIFPTYITLTGYNRGRERYSRHRLPKSRGFPDRNSYKPGRQHRPQSSLPRTYPLPEP